jgi:hypothetical protein
MPDHSALQALLQDRKSSTKGRASRRMQVCLDAKLSLTLALAEEDLAAVEAAILDAEAGAEKRAGGKLAIDPGLAEEKAAKEAAVAEAETAADAATVTITFTALKANDYDELLKQHPPREGNQLDAIDDRNNATFPDALMVASATKIEDAEGNLIDMDVADLLGTLSNGERIIACQVANDVNSKTLSIPSSDANSQNRRRSGSSSNRR